MEVKTSNVHSLKPVSTLKLQICPSFLRHCREGEWSQKGASCELASVTLKYNSMPSHTPLTLILIHHMGWITVLTCFGVTPPPPAHSQTLIQTGLWSGQDPSWPLFHYSVAKSLRKDSSHPPQNHRERCACRVCACTHRVQGYQSSGAMNMFIWQRGHRTWQDSQHLQTKRQSVPQPIGIQPHSSVIVHFPATIHVMSCFSNPGVPFLRKVIEKHNTIIRDRGMARNKGLSESSGNARRILKNRRKLPFRVMIYSFIETDSRTVLHISHKLPTLVDGDLWKKTFQPRDLKNISQARPFPFLTSRGRPRFTVVTSLGGSGQCKSPLLPVITF